ncbi:CbrC family protein [Rhodopirellula halodulae]|uniref:CbrC family protein n=1 Tax=Rhodopirellula halodulae TaxID=2894198 RepID=UPI001E3D335C|nr:CbrC family protein [Rhodopirellula sp. JC737]MCC9656698.1 CbrC family protein [Rhodopirellula sp. JC737]
MGITFRYIADIALEPSELGECQCCERAAAVSYNYRGEIVDPSAAANSKLAEEEPEIYAACAGCINAGLVRKSEYEIADIQKLINRFASDKQDAVKQYHRIPHIPLMMQGEDWPLCCGDWCEFIGVPTDYNESVRVVSQHQFWDRRPVEPHWDFELKPESLREICIFRCLSCRKTYFIWQPT